MTTSVAAPASAPEAEVESLGIDYGDPVAALNQLHDLFASRLLAYTTTMLRNREDAEDAVQTTFMNVYNSLVDGRVPRPPLTLDEIFPCGDDEMLQFINSGKFGYLRTILRNQELPAADLVTAHLRQVLKLRPSASSDAWAQRALTEIIALLKDDYPQLMDVLGAVSEIV